MSGESYDGYGHVKQLSANTTQEELVQLYSAWSKTYDKVNIGQFTWCMDFDIHMYLLEYHCNLTNWFLNQITESASDVLVIALKVYNQ
jgi:hypothetical protein